MLVSTFDADAFDWLPEQSGGSRLRSPGVNTESKPVDQRAKRACLHVLITFIPEHLLTSSMHVCLHF